MADQFELFHLSLLPRVQHDWIDVAPEKITRENWLRKVFGEEQPFSNYGADFHYVYTQPDAEGMPIIGRVGRHVVREENRPPSEGLEDFSHDTWLAALLVLDPTHHEDGQKLAIQNVNNVGAPKSLVKNLIAAINARYPSGPYSIEVAQIIEERSFWQYVEENKGNITSMTLDFIAPNMFGSEDEFSNEMTAFKESEKAQKVKLTVANGDGIEPDTPRMRRAVQYATKGGGRIRARAKGKKSYNSDDSVKRSFLDDVRVSGIELVEAARNLTKRILGRE